MTPKLIYTAPTEQEAREHLEKFPGAHVSTFACQYPGRYYEAAEMIRKVMRIDNQEGSK